MINQEWYLKTKWFAESSPVNKAKASLAIGSGDNGVVTITADEYGTDGNDFTVEVAVAEGASADMTAELTGNDILVTLGTGEVAGTVDNTKNTATLIATAIAALTGVTATASGTGATAFTEAIAKDLLEGGCWATPCPEVNTIVKDTTYHYICTTAGNKDTCVWKRFTLSAY